MQLKRRSDQGSRWAQLSLLGAVVVTLAGCRSGPHPADFRIELGDMVNPHLFKYERTDLTPQKLEERMKEADANYAEPRTYGRVYLSYENCLNSISERNDYEALWRAARACAWIARQENLDHSVRLQFAGKGIGIGEEATKRASTKPESHYYYALCLGALADLTRDPAKEDLRQMRNVMDIALRLDEKLDHCGPLRFLGDLYVSTSAYPSWALGTMDEGLAHLKRATELCPDFGENHLAYATALIEADEIEPARAELEKVQLCPTPRDHSTEHLTWLTEATELLTNLQSK